MFLGWKFFASLPLINIWCLPYVLTIFDIHIRRFLNSSRPRRNGRYNADDIFKCILLKENVWIPTKISLKFVPKGPINNIPALVQIMAWRRPGDKSLSEPMMVSFLTHICVTRPQWVNQSVQITPETYYTKIIQLTIWIWWDATLLWLDYRRLC